MDEFIIDVLTFMRGHMVELIGLGIVGFLTSTVKQVLVSYNSYLNAKKMALCAEANEQELIKQGLLSLLRFRINRLCYHIQEQGFITMDEKQDLDDMFKSYENLGGNGRTHMLYEETVKTKVKI